MEVKKQCVTDDPLCSTYPCNGTNSNNCNICDTNVGDLDNDFYPNYITSEVIFDPLPPASPVTKIFKDETISEELCNNRSNFGEWVKVDESLVMMDLDDKTLTNDCQDTNTSERTYESSCCKDNENVNCSKNSLPGFPGSGYYYYPYKLKCKRVKFTGDPPNCCLNNYNCNKNRSNNFPCFSDSERQKTCSNGQGEEKDFRTLVGQDCKDVLFDYCIGNDLDETDISWLERWKENPFVPSENYQKNSCKTAILQQSIILNEDRCNLPIEFLTSSENAEKCPSTTNYEYDPEGLSWSIEVLRQANLKYQQQGFKLGSFPNSPEYTEWQTDLYKYICCQHPILCQSMLRDTCENITEKDMSVNKYLTNFCGCYMDSKEYQDESVKYNIDRQCSSFCNLDSTVKQVTTDGNPLLCDQNICIINDNKVNLYSNEIQGNINFTQICGGCGDNNCTCYLSGNTITLANNFIGGNANLITQNCGSFVCSFGENEQTFALECSQENVDFYNKQKNKIEQDRKISNNFYNILVPLLIIIFIIFFILFIYFVK